MEGSRPRVPTSLVWIVGLAFLFAWTLGFACSYEHWEAAELLVQRGADVNGIEVKGKTHLDWLTLGKKEPGIRMLRALGGLLYDELGSGK